jgi:transcription-repair coupling factor (superfamily II helicase)
LFGANPSSHPFLAACARRWFPKRTIVIVTEALKKQEIFTQDLETWLRSDSAKRKLCFFPAWEVLPHETRLPHADVIAERLETLVALTQPNAAPMIVATPAALMQKTFTPGEIERRSKTLSRGDRIDPLDLIEWLEDQGYEPEAQVTQKGEIALRGGILDIFPLTNPWPVRLEFFGDELESLRTFDPLTQISRDEILSLSLAPAGELGFLKQQIAKAGAAATLLEHLPKDALLIFSEPDLIADHAYNYERHAGESASSLSLGKSCRQKNSHGGNCAKKSPRLKRKDFRCRSRISMRGGRCWRIFPIRRSPKRSGANFSVNCTAGCARITKSRSFATTRANASGSKKSGANMDLKVRRGRTPSSGRLSRGFIHDSAKIVVVTDAEIFGRYKVQRPRRMKSPHAAATRSALDIDFSELNEGDYVVHLQHGIGRFLGLKIVPPGLGTKLGRNE